MESIKINKVKINNPKVLATDPNVLGNKSLSKIETPTLKINNVDLFELNPDTKNLLDNKIRNNNDVFFSQFDDGYNYGCKQETIGGFSTLKLKDGVKLFDESDRNSFIKYFSKTGLTVKQCEKYFDTIMSDDRAFRINSLDGFIDYFENAEISENEGVYTLSDTGGIIGYVDKDTYEKITDSNAKSSEVEKIDNGASAKNEKIDKGTSTQNEKIEKNNNTYIDNLKESVTLTKDIVSNNWGAMAVGGVVGGVAVATLGFEIGAVAVGTTICSSIAGGISSYLKTK